MQDRFVLRDKFSKNLKNDIENLFKKGYNNICHEMVSSSDITKCDRRIYYTLTGVDNQISLSERMHHTYMIQKWSDILSKIKWFKLIEKEFVVADHNYNISSTVDIVGSINELPVVVMVREVTDEIFQSEIAKRGHVIENVIQMWLAEINDGFLIYENNITKEHSVFHILPNVSVLNSVKGKLDALRDCKIIGTPPERKYETPDAKECQECCFTEKCWRLIGDG
jgi:hypothetical protein